MVNLHIFHSISARELRAEDNIPLEARGLGVYFHVYQDADRPFYIGISDDKAGRNLDHLKNYLEKTIRWSKIPTGFP